MYINVHLQPMERRLVPVARRQVCWLDAGMDYSSPYASHETATSHIVKY